MAEPTTDALICADQEVPRADPEALHVQELGQGLEPREAFLRLSRLPHIQFFDSALKHPTLGRYSFLTADPFLWLWSRGTDVHISNEPRPRRNANPFLVLQELLLKYRLEHLPGLPPFQGGVAGLFGYDLCHHIERLPRAKVDDFQVPDLAVGFYDWVLAFDHALSKSWLISTGFPETESKKRHRRAHSRAQQILGLLEGRAAPVKPDRGDPAPILARQYCVEGHPGLTSSFSREGFLAAVERAIEYVHAGDCFQVNLAQRLMCPTRHHPVDLYQNLRERNGATFAGYLDLGEFVIASASPERFVRVQGREVETRPIKGTRPRSPETLEDERRAAELLASGKDRAENIMIVDLLRNDLGRVCEYGSVRVPALCRLESYAFVHHLVSEVRGKLRTGLGPIDLLRAAFPGGSVTGAPKIRAMEIIAELEPTARGAYCGCMGYIGFDGQMDANILIRTFTIGKGWTQFSVGGGIVANSVPELEYEETWHKARGLLKALQ